MVRAIWAMLGVRADEEAALYPSQDEGSSDLPELPPRRSVLSHGCES